MDEPTDTAAPGDVAEAISVGIRRARRDAELAERGWTRRFVGSPPRLGEMVELYESLGNEVLLDPVTDDELAEACAGCTLALTLFKVIYTRRET